MKLTHLANQIIIVSRLMTYTGAGAKLALSTVTSCLAHLQPIAAEKVSLIGGVYGKTYRIFVEGDIDIQENDQLKDEAGNLYTVRKGGGTKWTHGIMDFQEIIITRT